MNVPARSVRILSSQISDLWNRALSDAVEREYKHAESAAEYRSQMNHEKEQNLVVRLSSERRIVSSWIQGDRIRRILGAKPTQSNGRVLVLFGFFGKNSSVTMLGLNRDLNPGPVTCRVFGNTQALITRSDNHTTTISEFESGRSFVIRNIQIPTLT